MKEQLAAKALGLFENVFVCLESMNTVDPANSWLSFAYLCFCIDHIYDIWKKMKHGKL